MKRYLILVLFLVSIQARSQFAIINDNDGYTNIREEKNINSKIIGRLFNDDVYLYDTNDLSPTDDWVHVFYLAKLNEIEPYKKDFYIKEKQNRNENEVYFDGYIHKSRLLPLEELKKLNKITPKAVNGELNFRNDTLNFLIKIGKFIETEHKISKGKSVDNYRIDGCKPNGVLGFIPSIEIKNMKLSINSKPIEIPKEAYKDLFQSSLEACDLYVDKRGVMYIFLPYNSDGGAGYFVVWIFKNNKYLKRYIDSIG